MSWLDKITAFLRGKPESSDSQSRVFKDAALGKGKRGELAARQRDLAERLEQLMQAYDDRLQGLSGTIREMGEDCPERELERVEELQETMQAAFLRLEAASRATQDLKRDISYWSNRMGEEDADKRIEVLKSELVLRGVRSESEVSRVEIEPEEVMVEAEPEEEQVEPVFEAPKAKQAYEQVYFPEEEHLLRAIIEATREAERWHAIPVECQDEEAALQVRHLRDLNGQLKLNDRRRGVVRYRLPLAIRVR